MRALCQLRHWHAFRFVLPVFTCAMLIHGCKERSSLSDVKEGWDAPNTPSNNLRVRDYAQLSRPEFRTGYLNHIPWSDSYWPIQSVGMAQRWMEPVLPAFTLKTSTSVPNTDEAVKNYKAAVSSEVTGIIGGIQPLRFQPFLKTGGLSPAEKHDIALGDASFSFLRYEIERFGDYSRMFAGQDWSWMGHCHGWAPAAVGFEPPDHGVLLTTQKAVQQVLFTEGDIRGLLSKAVAESGMDQSSMLVGSRCSHQPKDLKLDANGRVLDAALGYWDSSKGLANYLPVWILADNWPNKMEFNGSKYELIVKIGPNYDASPIYWIQITQYLATPEVQAANEELYRIRLFNTVPDQGGPRGVSPNVIIASNDPSEVGLKATGDHFLANADGSLVRDPKPADMMAQQLMQGWPRELRRPEALSYFKYFKPCRDMNMGTFHIQMANYLSAGGIAANKSVAQGMVLDRTATAEVWNQPIYGFDTKMGQPTPVVIGEWRDPFLRWRKSGQHSRIVDVYTRLTYGVENGPLVHYTAADEQTDFHIYHYTLELDENGIIEGGEGHPLADDVDWDKVTPLSGEPLLQKLSRYTASMVSSQDKPDFIWFYPVGSKLNSGKVADVGLDLDLVTRLHQCSLDKTNLKTATLGKGQTITYKECTY